MVAEEQKGGDMKTDQIDAIIELLERIAKALETIDKAGIRVWTREA